MISVGSPRSSGWLIVAAGPAVRLVRSQAASPAGPDSSRVALDIASSLAAVLAIVAVRADAVAAFAAACSDAGGTGTGCCDAGCPDSACPGPDSACPGPGCPDSGWPGSGWPGSGWP